MKREKEESPEAIRQKAVAGRREAADRFHKTISDRKGKSLDDDTKAKLLQIVREFPGTPAATLAAVPIRSTSN